MMLSKVANLIDEFMDWWAPTDYWYYLCEHGKDGEIPVETVKREIKNKRVLDDNYSYIKDQIEAIKEDYNDRDKDELLNLASNTLRAIDEYRASMN